MALFPLQHTHRQRIRVDFYIYSTRLRCTYCCVFICFVCVCESQPSDRAVHPCRWFPGSSPATTSCSNLGGSGNRTGCRQGNLGTQQSDGVDITGRQCLTFCLLPIKYISKIFIFLFHSILARYDRWNTTFVFALVWSTLIQKCNCLQQTKRSLGSSQTHSINYEICFLKTANCLLISEHKQKWPSTSILWNLWVKYETKK